MIFDIEIVIKSDTFIDLGKLLEMEEDVGDKLRITTVGEHLTLICFTVSFTNHSYLGGFIDGIYSQCLKKDAIVSLNTHTYRG